MIGDRGHARPAVLVLAVLVVLAAVVPAVAAAKPRAIVVLPFDASTLAREDQWLGEGIAQVVTLSLAQHPAFVQVDRARLKPLGEPEIWGEDVVVQSARTIKADAALFGRVTVKDADLVFHPRLAEIKGASADTLALEPVTVPLAEVRETCSERGRKDDSPFLARVSALPVVYARALRATVNDAERSRMDRAARPTSKLCAFHLFTRGQVALLKPGQEGREAAVDLLSRAIEADPNFVVAQYTLGNVHQALGNRWKAAAQYRAATQLDPTAPEPLKALGDLFLAAPRRLFDQAVEAYAKAIELRPFYAEAHVGLGDAKAAKGDVDGAIAAYQKALVYNPINPRVHLSLGKIYYAEKGLYYEAVNAYKKAIDIDPGSVDARMGLGEVYEEKGLYREALDEYRKVMDLDGKHTGALYNLALVYEKVDPREAIVQWERYIALASQLPSERDWVDVARQHVRKLRNQLKE
ncbi:MAG: tetratricopeptide repeat protein [Candidatus Rokubacteria bacterium]|nr:tetratricopeptide repeat protein [Candidatus Rokubacteria bacterium]